MFKKFSESRAKKKLKPVTDILSVQENILNQIEKKSSAIEALQDDAEKILNLHVLVRDISQARQKGLGEVDAFITTRENKAGSWGILGAGTATCAAVVGGGVAASFPPLAMLTILALPAALGGGALGEKISRKKSGKLMEREAYLSYFDNIIAAQKNSAQETLKDLENNCDLAALSLSPHFKKVTRVSAAIHERVTDAATEATRQALKENASLKPRPPRLVQKK